MAVKRDIARQVSDRTGLTIQDSLELINILLGSIKKLITEDNEIKIKGFGTFTFRMSAAHDILTPDKKMQVHIPDTKIVFFKPSQRFRDAVNKPTLYK